MERVEKKKKIRRKRVLEQFKRSARRNKILRRDRYFDPTADRRN